MKITDISMSLSLQLSLIPGDGKIQPRMRHIIGFIKEIPKVMSVCMGCVGRVGMGHELNASSVLGPVRHSAHLFHLISFILFIFSYLIFHICLLSRPPQLFLLLYNLPTPIRGQVTKPPIFHTRTSTTASLLVFQLLLIPSPVSTQLPDCPSGDKLEHVTSLAKTLPWYPSLLDFDVHIPPQNLALAPVSNLMSFLPPLTHPVSATLAFFPFHDCAKTLSTSGPLLLLFFCLE